MFALILKYVVCRFWAFLKFWNIFLACLFVWRSLLLATYEMNSPLFTNWQISLTGFLYLSPLSIRNLSMYHNSIVLTILFLYEIMISVDNLVTHKFRNLAFCFMFLIILIHTGATTGSQGRKRR